MFCGKPKASSSPTDEYRVLGVFDGIRLGADGERSLWHRARRDVDAGFPTQRIDDSEPVRRPYSSESFAACSPQPPVTLEETPCRGLVARGARQWLIFARAVRRNPAEGA